MDEFSVQFKARQFIAKLDLSNIQTDLSVYLKAVNARLVEEELGEGESGTTFTRPDGKHIITVNALEREERQRFTICHEIAHIVLNLPSQHEEDPSWSYAKRHINEIYCDAFAAELLMPVNLWKSNLPDEEPSIGVVTKMASAFGCSFPAAASRFATLAEFPCAYITMQNGIVRYMARSTKLRNMRAWVPPKSKMPSSSLASKLREIGLNDTKTVEVAQDAWFEGWESGLYMVEIARHYQQSDTTVSLIWFEEDELPEREFDRFGKVYKDDGGLAEMTGDLPWPGHSKRR